MRWMVWLGLGFLLACSDRTEAPIVPSALSVGTAKQIYVATSRMYEKGEFGINRSPQVTFMDMTVSIPPNREVGSISDGRSSPNPKSNFALASMDRLPSAEAFTSAIRNDVIGATKILDQEITIYVHGYNNSFTDAAFRMAQLSHDLNLTGPVVSYAWPSRGNPLGYEYDADSALFARDGLAETIDAINKAGARRIVLVGHSMGGRIVMETLRQFELASPGWAANANVGVLLISPDVNIDVFHSQVARFTEWPQPFIIFKSRRDRLLRLSATLRGEEVRLGNIEDPTILAEYPIALIDVTAFEDADSANHFVAGSSGSLLRLIRSARELDDAFLQGSSSASVSILGSSRRIGDASAVTITLGPDNR